MQKVRSTSPVKTFFVNLALTPIAGLIVGVIAISNTITLGALIFSNSLPNQLPYGIGIALFSGLVISVMVTILGTTAGLVAYPQAATATITALLVTQITNGMPTKASPEEIFSTVIAALWLSTFTTGLIFAIFGRLKLGKAFRFMPYPVFGGFLAGLGWLIVKGGLKMMVVFPLTLNNLSQWILTENFFRWFPGVILAVMIFVIQRQSQSPLILPVLLFLGVGFFYLAAYLTNSSFTQLSEQGWLLGSFSGQVLWRPMDLGVIFRQAHWPIIASSTFTFMTITFTGLIGTLFNCSGIELVTKEDIQLDRELQVSGIANVVASLGGGIIGYHSVSLSSLPQKFGIRNRLVGLVAAGLVGYTLYYGSAILSYVPKLLVGGLLVYLGISFLYKWVIDSWKLLSKSEYLVLILILIVISMFGFLAGVLVGILATAILFAISYSQINVIKNSLSGKNFQSNVSRNPHHSAYLQEHGESLYILKLQGFIFFGTAFNLMNSIRERIENKNQLPLRFVVLDFRLVNGVDSSALNSFIRIRFLAENNNFFLLFSDLTPEIENQMLAEKIIVQDDQLTKIFPDLDRTVEWCEQEILSTDEITLFFLPSLKSQLMDSFDKEADIEGFFEFLEPKEIDENVILIEKGSPPNGLFFIEDGKVTVQLGTPEGETIRLRTMGGGTIVGELGMYLGNPASATVITETKSVVQHLTFEALQKMEAEKPKIAAAFHKHLAVMISKRLVDTNATLQALLD